MKIFLKLISIPILLIVLDLYFRSELLERYNEKQLNFYLSSVVISIGYFVLILLILKAVEHKKWLYYSLMILIFPWFVFSFFGSFTFYSLNGIFPNYYTFLYFKTEPKSAMMILRDATGWQEVLAILSLFTLLFVFIKWFTKKHVPKIHWSYLLIYAVVQLSAFETLIYFHEKFDQCAMVDTNFAACVQRHAFTWDDHSEFTGRGLQKRMPPKMDLKLAKKDFNVVVLVFESYRKRSASLYGNKHETTPYFKKLAQNYPEEFFYFRQPVSVSSTTMLAAPAILTGIGPYQDTSILYRQPLLWEYAQLFDYRTFFLSSHTLKWYRFDQFYQKEKLDLWWNKDNSGLPYFNDLGIKDEHTVRKLNKTIKHLKKEPFFGVVQFNTTHYPYEIPEKYNKWTETFSDSYDNAVHYQDELIKLFFENLKAQGLMDKTLVFITSDHGESLMEHRTIGHVETNYTEAISVPLIAYIPKGILNKTETKNLKKNLHQLTSNIDIAPTLFDLFELEKEEKLNHFYQNYSGFSLLKPIPNKRTVISLNNNQVANFNTGLSIAQKEWHYLFRTNIVPNKEEFYFWKKDIAELKNKSKSLTKTQRNQILKLVEKYPVCDKLREKAKKNY